jgi:hypothetical protein
MSDLELDRLFLKRVFGKSYFSQVVELIHPQQFRRLGGNIGMPETFLPFHFENLLGPLASGTKKHQTRPRFGGIGDKVQKKGRASVHARRPKECGQHERYERKAGCKLCSTGESSRKICAQTTSSSACKGRSAILSLMTSPLLIGRINNSRAPKSKNLQSSTKCLVLF